MSTLAVQTLTHNADRSRYVLFASAVAFTVCNVISPNLPSDANGIAGGGIWSLLVFEVLAFSIWTALGPGRFVVRLAIALPTLHLIFAVSAYLTAWFADSHWSVLLAASLAWLATYILSLSIFLLFRKFTRLRFQSISAVSQEGPADLRFSLKQLIALFTLYALAFGVTLKLAFSKQLPVFFFTVLSAQESFHLYVQIYLFMGVVGTAFALPLTAIPLLILYGKPPHRAIFSSIVFWLIVTTSFAAYLLLTQSNQYPNADASLSLKDVCQILVIPQAFLILDGILTAVPLRLAGYRLIRTPKVHDSPTDRRRPAKRTNLTSDY